MKQDLGPANIRITGYGVDDGVDNQTEQTHVGPNAGSSGTTMRYQTDTECGNSGGPVIDDATGMARPPASTTGTASTVMARLRATVSSPPAPPSSPWPLPAPR